MVIVTDVDGCPKNTPLCFILIWNLKFPLDTGAVNVAENTLLPFGAVVAPEMLAIPNELWPIGTSV